ncbi:hypothetical protein AVEN_71377-1 [Araneus ventricosus]|uniref:Uncharacterized protein n=1 Tax=Araneus ventricosus TaxID=182803 RepID=A0A4Y2BI38_ARAVE|nr:hypothetical protein AVEN_71377-1 [Araneus ventricosus]
MREKRKKEKTQFMSQLKDGRSQLAKTDDDNMSENGFIFVVRQVYLTCCPSSVVAFTEVFVYAYNAENKSVRVNAAYRWSRWSGRVFIDSSKQK